MRREAISITAKMYATVKKAVGCVRKSASRIWLA
jgi:hypothetical protein